jgi:hypothetical protein
MDTLKSRFQSNLTYRSSRDCFLHTSSEGLRGFYKGYQFCLLRSFVANGAMGIGIQFAKYLTLSLVD